MNNPPYQSATGRQGENPKIRRGGTAVIGDILAKFLPFLGGGPAGAPVSAGPAKRRQGLRCRLVPAVCCHPLLGWRDMIGLAVVWGRPATGPDAGLSGGVSRLAKLLGEYPRRWGRRVKRWRQLGLVKCLDFGRGWRGRIVRVDKVPPSFGRRFRANLERRGWKSHPEAGGRHAPGIAAYGYCDLPAGLLSEATLSLAARAVWGILYWLATWKPARRAWPSERTLCRWLRMWPILLRRSLADLAAAGVIAEVGVKSRGVRVWAVRKTLGGAWLGVEPVAQLSPEATVAAVGGVESGAALPAAAAAGQMGQTGAVNDANRRSKWDKPAQTKHKASLITSSYQAVRGEALSSRMLNACRGTEARTADPPATEADPAPSLQTLADGATAGRTGSAATVTQIAGGQRIDPDGPAHFEYERQRVLAGLAAVGVAVGGARGSSLAFCAAKVNPDELDPLADKCHTPKEWTGLLITLGVDERQAPKLMAQYGPELVGAVIKLLAKRLRTGKVIANPAGWVVAALKKNYPAKAEEAAATDTMERWAAEGVGVRSGETSMRLLLAPSEPVTWPAAAALCLGTAYHGEIVEEIACILEGWRADDRASAVATYEPEYRAEIEAAMKRRAVGL